MQSCLGHTLPLLCLYWPSLAASHRSFATPFLSIAYLCYASAKLPNTSPRHSSAMQFRSKSVHLVAPPVLCGASLCPGMAFHCLTLAVPSGAVVIRSVRMHFSAGHSYSPALPTCSIRSRRLALLCHANAGRIKPMPSRRNAMPCLAFARQRLALPSHVSALPCPCVALRRCSLFSFSTLLPYRRISALRPSHSKSFLT